MIAGIDFSTRAVDIVLLDEDSDAATWHRFELTGNDAFDRARYVRQAMPYALSEFWDDVVAIGIEQPRGNFGVTHMMRIQGAVLACIYLKKLVQPWNPASWRKTVGLPGNASKLEVAALVDTLRPGGRPLWPQDACDAYCIALATRMQIQMGAAA